METRQQRADANASRRSTRLCRKRHPLNNDIENPQAGKRLKNENRLIDFNVQRRPLADIKEANIDGPKITRKRSILGRRERQPTNNANTEQRNGQSKIPPQLSGIERIPIGKPVENESSKREIILASTEKLPKVGDEKCRLNLIKEQNLALLMVVSYSDQIFNYLFESENRYQIQRDHLSGQAFNPNMRSVLVNWLADVAYHMNLYQETVQLTVYILDKFMSIDKTTTKDNAQLIGLGALFIAAKYEETEAVTLMDLRKVCNIWTCDDLKRMESAILRTIGYDLGKPLPIHFIRRLSERGRTSPMEHNYAKYFADSFLLCYSYSHSKSSTIAAASVFLALCVSEERVDSNLWTPQLVVISRHKLVDFSHLLSSIAKIVTSGVASKLGALHSRYASADLHCVSLMPGCQPGRGIINHFCID